ncbi:hypothetical protein [Herbiconiux liangxiaofengii]|uniref:hypothetical protein n=1 Tax=Herbiconiux liangxiaofengii TaxID=3342795 RepID=UPI0035B90AA4
MPANGSPLPTTTERDFGRLSLHPRMMNATVLLHEVAHCLASTQFGNLKQIRKGKFDSGRHHDHGEHFRGAFAAPAERYRIGVDPLELRRAYLHFELETSSLEEVADARAHSAEVERAHAELWARLERERESDPERVKKRKRMEEARLAHEAEVALGEADQGRSSKDWPPSSFWGEWIWFNRSIRFRPRVSQKRLAAGVAQVVRCTARDISRLEWSEEKPESSLDMKRCAAIAAVLRVDPVWAETHRGVAPGSLTLTLEELEPIASEWVEQIRHLNLLLKQRPQRWRVEGD